MRLLNLSDLFEQIVDVADLHVDAGEADVGYLVEAFKVIGDTQADVDGRDFALAQAEQALFHGVDELLDLLGGDRPFVTGLLDTRGQLLAVVGDPGPVALAQ